MSILWEKSTTWRWLVRRTRDSKPFFVAFATLCGIVPGVLGFCVMQATSSRTDQLEAHLRTTARPESTMMGQVNKERLAEFLGELQRKQDTNDRYVAALKATASSPCLPNSATAWVQKFGENEDLSYNQGLTGQLPASIGGLSKLVNLILVGCSFSGQIPGEIGSLSRLVYLSLNSNSFTGTIPPTIGKLSKLYWLDLASNKLTGSIPVSDGTTPGLDLLTNTKHFHFDINRLSGVIPSKLFSSNMQLIHVLFDNNNFSGSIPSTLGLVATLEVLRLDMNSLTGHVPTNLNSLTRVAKLHLANNKLTGPLPDLTGMNALSFVS